MMHGYSLEIVISKIIMIDKFSLNHCWVELLKIKQHPFVAGIKVSNI